MSNFQITESIRVPRWLIATAAITGGMVVCFLVLLLSGHTAGASDLAPPMVSVPSAQAEMHPTSTASAPLPPIGESPAETDPTRAAPVVAPNDLLATAPSAAARQLAGQVATTVSGATTSSNLGGLPAIPRSPSPLPLGTALPVAVAAPHLLAGPAAAIGRPVAGARPTVASQLRGASRRTPQVGIGREDTPNTVAQPAVIKVTDTEGRGRSPRRPIVPLGPFQLLVSLATTVGVTLHGGSLGSLPPATLVLAFVVAAVVALERRRIPRMRVDPRCSPPG